MECDLVLRRGSVRVQRLQKARVPARVRVQHGVPLARQKVLESLRPET